MIEKSSPLFRTPKISILQLIDSKIISFGLVGSVGFAVDALVLTVLTVKFGLDVLPSRTISFSCATFVTWLLNRAFTFSNRTNKRAHARKKEYFLYLFVQVVGAALNFCVFLMLIEWSPALKQTPVIPLAAGAVVALVFNFTLSRKFVFINRSNLNE